MRALTATAIALLLAWTAGCAGAARKAEAPPWWQEPQEPRMAHLESVLGPGASTAWRLEPVRDKAP